jgi:hypothetical protein
MRQRGRYLLRLGGGGRFCFLARASAGSTNIVATTAAAMIKLRMIMFSFPQSSSASRFTALGGNARKSRSEQPTPNVLRLPQRGLAMHKQKKQGACRHRW